MSNNGFESQTTDINLLSSWITWITLSVTGATRIYKDWLRQNSLLLSQADDTFFIAQCFRSVKSLLSIVQFWQLFENRHPYLVFDDKKLFYAAFFLSNIEGKCTWIPNVLTNTEFHRENERFVVFVVECFIYVFRTNKQFSLCICVNGGWITLLFFSTRYMFYFWNFIVRCLCVTKTIASHCKHVHLQHQHIHSGLISIWFCVYVFAYLAL